MGFFRTLLRDAYTLAPFVKPFEYRQGSGPAESQMSPSRRSWDDREGQWPFVAMADSHTLHSMSTYGTGAGVECCM